MFLAKQDPALPNAAISFLSLWEKHWQSAPVPLSQCALSALMLWVFRLSLKLLCPGLHSVPSWLHFPLWLPHEISATIHISCYRWTILDLRPRPSSIWVAKSRVVTLFLSLENEGIIPFPYVPQAMEQKKLKMMNTSGSEFVLQPS